MATRKGFEKRFQQSKMFKHQNKFIRSKSRAKKVVKILNRGGNSHNNTRQIHEFGNTCCLMILNGLVNSAGKPRNSRNGHSPIKPLGHADKFFNLVISNASESVKLKLHARPHPAKSKAETHADNTRFIKRRIIYISGKFFFYRQIAH